MAINKKRLRDLESLMRTISKEAFDQEIICGTACCQIGHYFARFPRRVKDSCDAIEFFGIRAMEHFGLTKEQADELFESPLHQEFPVRTPLAAAKKLKAFIESNGECYE